MIAALLAGAMAAPAAAKKQTRLDEEHINFRLGLDYSHWLVGAIREIASEEEVRAYLALTDDGQAEAFIADFWSRRADPEDPFRSRRDIFSERAAEADRLFTEATHLGRRTDRGIIHILYGPPEESRFETEKNRRARVVEVWSYAKDAPPGLDGKPPKRIYQFTRKGDVMVRYVPRRETTLFDE